MKHFRLMISALLLTAAASCTKNETAGSGQVRFDVQGNYHITEQTRSYVSDYTSLPSAADFNLTVTGTSTTFKWSGSISEWKDSRKIPEGSYTATVSYGSLDQEGPHKPYFTGSASFDVVADELTDVEVPASLGNTIVMISCSDAFRNYFSDCTFTIGRNGEVIATQGVDAAEPVFLDGYKFTVSGTTSRGDFSKDFTGLDAATAYTIHYDVENVAGVRITVTFDDKVETVELGYYDLND